MYVIQVIETQYNDVKAALVGQGDFELSDGFKKFEVPVDVWSGMTSENKDRHFKKFMKKVLLKDKKTVLSTDGTQAFTGPGTMGGKKPHKRKRRRQAKTTSYPAKKKL